MDIKRVKEIKDKLLSDEISFTVITDENYTFQHIPTNETARVFFDDASETAVAVKIDDCGAMQYTVFEYQRILQFEVCCKNDYIHNTELLKKFENIGLVSNNLLSDMKDFIDTKFNIKK